MTAYAARHAIPRVPRTPLHHRLAAVLRHPLRGLQIRRWCAALRRDAAALAEDDAWFALQRRQWQLRMGRQLRAAPTLTDMTVVVRRPEYADCTQADITGGRWWLQGTAVLDGTVLPVEVHHGTAGIIAAAVHGPYEYREGQ